jgi:thiol-disulfide isomerase/thioredoxin
MASNYEENFWETIWNFLPGLTKFFSVIAIIGLIFNVFTLAVTKSDVVLDSGNFDVSIQRSYNFVTGNKDSKVKLLYFVDYQCPACRGNQPTMTQIQTQYSERVAIVYKHFPLKTIHIYAESMARAVQAAGKQNKYKEFGEKAFDLQDGSRYSAASLEGVARDLGLNVEQWNKDRNSDEVAKQVENDTKDLEAVELSANSNGVVKPANSISSSDTQSLGTPTSILYKDGKVVDWWTGGLPSDELQAKLDNALK